MKMQYMVKIFIPKGLKNNEHDEYCKLLENF